ncbi:MAG: DUF4139 domain-containing protein [Gammaproteobacteria bacterium]|nr:DUF4139 domain-containing protein [Gammaproteobacteria bacterium]
MNRPLSLLAVACLLAACSPPRPPGNDQVATSKPAPPADARAAGNRESNGRVTRLSIYSGDYDAVTSRELRASSDMPGFALVDRPLHYALKRGSNRVSAAGIPPAMDIEAVTLRPQTDGVTVSSQRFVAPPAGTRDVLATAIGHKVAVEHTAGGAKQTDSGTLIAVSDGLTLALPDGRIKVIREYDNFSIIEAGDLLPQRATLQWTVEAARAGEAAFVLSYPMGGIAWRAEYLATLARDEGCRLALDGAALVANRSGVTFGNARLTLIAGEPNRVRRERVYPTMAADMAMAREEMQGAQAMPTQRTSGEYHAYELPGTSRVSNGATERAPLFARLPAVTCERAYETTPEIRIWPPPVPMLEPGFNSQTGPQPVKATVSFANNKAAGLGQPLPAGRVRVFDGEDFLGESRLEHTAEGADIRLEVGTAFDLTAERERSEFRVDRSGRTMTESFIVTLNNAKKTEAVIRVVEPLPRWSDWEIVSSNVPASKRDAQRAEFEVPVAPGGEAALTYTVRYRWPEGVRP